MNYFKVTYHAAERFLERVKNKKKYSKKEVKETINYLNGLFKDVLSDRKYLIIPGFSNFVGVLKGSKIVTIVKKRSK